MTAYVVRECYQVVNIPFATPSLRDRITNAGKNNNLKKQSQFTPDMMGVNPFMQGDYGINPPGGAQQNKANQSQTQWDNTRGVPFDATFWSDGAPRNDRPPESAIG